MQQAYQTHKDPMVLMYGADLFSTTCIYDTLP